MRPERRTYRLLDVDLAVCAPEDVLDAFHRVYGRFQAPCPCAVCGSVEPLEIEIAVETQVAGPCVVGFSRRGPDRPFHEDRADRGQAPSTVVELPEAQVFTYLLYLVQNHLVRSSRTFYAVHGACLEVGGRGCVLSAASCVGKTTLALELVRRGAGFLSDEIAAVPVHAPGVHAFPRAVGLRPGSVGVLGLEQAVRVGFSPGHGELKHFLDVADQVPGAPRPASGLDVVVLLAPPHEDAGADEGHLGSLELCLTRAPETFVSLLGGIKGVERVVALEDRAVATIRILHHEGVLIVKAVDEAARACGALISGHHRGRSRPIDYEAAPVSRALSTREGVKRLAGQTLNLRGALATESAPAVFGRFAARFGGVRYVEVVPGELGATADLIEKLCGNVNVRGEGLA